jgi:outer membrane protein assembly factor BamB
MGMIMDRRATFPVRRLALLLVASLALTIGSSGDTRAADPASQPAAFNPDSFYGKDSTSGVYVRDSAVALENFALGQRMERLKEWGKSADIFQEILEKYSDRVVPSRTDKDNVIRGYTSVAAAVQGELSHWPREGLDVYRGRFESAAAALLHQARRDDLATLSQVYSRYFVTDSARTAAIELMNADMERGEFAAAAWIGQRLLSQHPNLDSERPRLLYRTAEALHLSGDDKDAAGARDELATRFADATATVHGQSVRLADALKAELALPASIRVGATGESYTTFGGDPSRDEILPGGAKPGARLYSIPLTPPNWPSISDAASRGQAQSIDQMERDKGAAIGMMPVADRGQLFFQDNTHVYALDLDSGLPLAGWSATYPDHGYYAMDAWGMPRYQQMTITVNDNAVLAVLGQADFTLQGSVGTGSQNPTLVCLDRESGRTRWTKTTAALPESADAVRAMQFGGAPLVVGNEVYIVARGTKAMQFQDSYVVCLDLSTGDYRWSTYVASAGSTFMVNGIVSTPRDVASLGYSSGRVLVITNVGAVAALDAFDGSVAWLNIYRQQGDIAEGPIMGGGFMQARMGMNIGVPDTKDLPNPFTYNPAMVQNGRLFAMPSDSRFLFIFDVATGAEVARIERADFNGTVEGKADPIMLIGVINDIVYLGGDDRILALNWKKYTHENPMDCIVWVEGMEHIRGRPLLTNELVYVPTATSLLWVRVSNGKIVDKYPKDDSWTLAHGPGNVLTMPDHVIIAGGGYLDVYTDLDAVRHKLDASILVSPTDPELRLKYAEMLFAAGQNDATVTKLDEAIELLGGRTALAQGAMRDRLFNDAVTFAARVKGPRTLDTAAALFDRAGLAAASTSQQVRYRIARAQWAASQGTDALASAISLYQEILADPAMRTVGVVTGAADNGVDRSQAAIFAEGSIAALMKKTGGSAAYAPFENEAQRRFTAARDAADPAELQSVAHTYPNSSVAQNALFAAADVFETRNDPRQANRVLRQIYLKLNGKPNARVLESLARNYLAMPGRVDAAVSRLAQAARTMGKTPLQSPLKLPDGSVLTNITFFDAYTAAKHYSGQLSVGSLPDLHFPTHDDYVKYRRETRQLLDPLAPEDPKSIITGIATMVRPLAGFERNDTIAGWNASQGLRVFPVGSATPMLTIPMAKAPQNLAWIGSSLLAWTDDQLFRTSDTGSTPSPATAGSWKVDLKSLPDVDVVSGSGASVVTIDTPPSDGAAAGAPPPPPAPDINPPFNLVRVAGGMIIQPVQMPQAGEYRMTVAPTGVGEKVTFVHPLDDRLIVATSAGRVMALSAVDGSLLWQTRIANRPIDRLLANDDFIVLRLADDITVELVVLDCDSGSLLTHRNFPVGAPGGEYPINVALASDGTLVWSEVQRLCIKDLYEPGLEPRIQTTPEPDRGLFGGAGRPDQLLVAGGTILALSDDGSSVRLYSLESGDIRRYIPGPGRAEIEASLPTQAQHRDWDVSVRVVGPYLYAISPNCVVAYNLDHPEISWHCDQNLKPAVSDTIIGRDYLILACGTGPSVTLNAFDRATIQHNSIPTESGLLAFVRPVADASPIGNVVGVEGGLYYLASDNRLHFLKGARP